MMVDGVAEGQAYNLHQCGSQGAGFAGTSNDAESGLVSLHDGVTEKILHIQTSRR
jgi:hypothetical protein